MFGLSYYYLRDRYPELKDTPLGDVRELDDIHRIDFLKVISSGKSPAIKDPGELKLSILSLHDACYEINETFYGEEVHESLRPMEMKAAYDLCGEGSMLSQISDEFVLADIYKYTGLTLKDWLNLPRFNQETVKRSVDRKKNIELEINRSLAQELEDTKKNSK